MKPLCGDPLRQSTSCEGRDKTLAELCMCEGKAKYVRRFLETMKHALCKNHRFTYNCFVAAVRLQMVGFLQWMSHVAIEEVLAPVRRESAQAPRGVLCIAAERNAPSLYTYV